METTSTLATPAELVVQVRAEMIRQDITVADLATLLGVAQSTLRGRLATPSAMRYRDLLDIAAALNVPFSTLVCRAEERAA